MTITPGIDLATVHLDRGSHSSPDQGVCAVELASILAGREITDRPPCVSPVLGAMLRNWNDGLPDDERQMLVPLIPHVVGTAATPEIEQQRSFLALDWLVHVYDVRGLRGAGLEEHAAALESLPPLTSLSAVRSAAPVLEAAARDARDARDAWAAWAAWDAWAAWAARDARAAWDARDAWAAWDARDAWAAWDARAARAAWDARAARAASSTGAADRTALREALREMQMSELGLLARMIALPNEPGPALQEAVAEAEGRLASVPLETAA